LFTLIFGEEYKLWHSSLCSFLHPPVTSFSPVPCSQTHTVFSLNVTDKVHTHTKQVNDSFVCSNLYAFRQQTGRQKIWHHHQ
jgi:hypothetical protein